MYKTQLPNFRTLFLEKGRIFVSSVSFFNSAATTARLSFVSNHMEDDEQCIGSPVGLFYATFLQCRTLRQLLNQLRHLSRRAVLQYSASGLLFQVPLKDLFA
jgi:hypothetical protein